MEKIQAIRGTKDILPDTITFWHYLFDNFKNVSHQFGYEEIRTPIIEKTEVFNRSIGEQTDIVNKEMYTFLDKGGESITLRPEATAAMVRSVIQNSLIQEGNILRLWYFGPFFRYERPQKGRLRQFHQYGAELLGSNFPEADAEIIQLADALIKKIGLNDYKLLINSLGNEFSRNNYKNALVNFLKSKEAELSYDSKNRILTNPLRVLDSKDEQDITVLKDAPVILDYLDEESKTHFEELKQILNDLNIKFEIAPQLVRGLDYYSHTVFEFRSNKLGSQDSFGGGGRYDGLFEQLGGKATPAVGFAFGLERLILILEASNLLPNIELVPDFYIVAQNLSYKNYVHKIAESLRNLGKKVITDIARKSFKAQMREANKLKSKFAIIIGEEEFKNHTCSVKNLSNGEQNLIKFDELKDITFLG
ncbi:MAG: histidine--tRNA ligase [Candidatus Kapaibacteriota bacterium]